MSQSAAYAPSPEFVRNANVQGMEGIAPFIERAQQDPQTFWGEMAEQRTGLVSKMGSPSWIGRIRRSPNGSPARRTMSLTTASIGI